MTSLREAAQQALEAYSRRDYDFGKYMDALRAALAEPVQERKPLTDDEVVSLFNRLCKERAGYPDRRYRDFARWVEAAHGIGKKP